MHLCEQSSSSSCPQSPYSPILINKHSTDWLTSFFLIINAIRYFSVGIWNCFGEFARFFACTTIFCLPISVSFLPSLSFYRPIWSIFCFFSIALQTTDRDVTSIDEMHWRRPNIFSYNSFCACPSTLPSHTSSCNNVVVKWTINRTNYILSAIQCALFN